MGNSKFKEPIFFNFQMLVDYLVVMGGLQLSYAVFVGIEGFSRYSLTKVNLMVTVLSFILFTIYKPYYCGRKKFVDSLLNVMVALFSIYSGVILIGYVFKETKIPFVIFLYAFIVSFFMFILEKEAMFKIFQRIHHKEVATIISQEKELETIGAKLIENLDHLHEVRYLLDCEKLSMETMKAFIHQSKVVFISEGVADEVKNELILYSYDHKKIIYLAPKVTSVIKHTSQFITLDDMPVMVVQEKFDTKELLVKRTFDLVMASVGLLFSMPVFLLVVLGIKIQDGGPVFYRQKRLTKDDKAFEIIKFRSMIKDAEKETGAVLAPHDDERITGFGRFLRKSRIDEIPQLFNILKGDMSIVGPRPERPELAEIYIDEMPEYAHRTRVKAGLTGLAQVWGRYNTTFKEKVILDLYYINRFTLTLDLRILFYTVSILFSSTAAKGLEQKKNLEEILSSRGLAMNHRGHGIIELTDTVK